jgi:hypothetical protein
MARARGILFAVAAAALPVTAQAQQLGGGGAAPGVSLVRIVAALAVCIAAAIGLALAIKGRKGELALRWPGRLAHSFGGSRRIAVIEARRVSAFADICLIRCDQIEYLLVCGPSGQSVLRQSEADAPQPVGASDHAH